MKRTLASTLIFLLCAFSMQMVSAASYLSLGFDEMDETAVLCLEEGDIPLEEDSGDNFSNQIPEEEEKEITPVTSIGEPVSVAFQVYHFIVSKTYELYLGVQSPPPKLS